jgi:hypothetical protein
MSGKKPEHLKFECAARCLLVSGSLLATRVAAVGLHQVLFVHDNAAKVWFV